MKQHDPPDPAETDRPTSDPKLILPPAPPSERGPVKAWEQSVDLPTYLPLAPDRNPLFLEHRVYQGSSGRVYPLPVIDRIEAEPSNHTWRALHLENEFLRLMVLPEIGGRIHVGLDKINDYDFFYRQNVIKPALVGLAGPWASGGVEFNWPQHHRPATFMPVDVFIEREPDGSATLWCSDQDPMTHMKGMHGLRLRPGKAHLEVRVRLYNRTTDTQTFLWWANVATHAHEQYQSFFPRDVRFVADHARRAITGYPLSQTTYYGVDYAERALHGVSADQTPTLFQPDGSYPPNDLGWYANIPVPTSYMIANSQGDFSGGYDHRRQAGTIAIANHHIAPGKKQWTWGNQDFGYAWDRSLTDSDGPYVELMVGAYTDNQPDFSFLAPGETKTFSVFWYPLREIGIPDHANVDAALRAEHIPTGLLAHLQVTSHFPDSTLLYSIDGQEVGRWHGDLAPRQPLHHLFETTPDTGAPELTLHHAGRLILRFAPAEILPAEPPTVATEPPTPQHCASADELFLSGLHLEQYRHPTSSPEAYWLEAIRRDPGDTRCNHAMGRWHLGRGEFQTAEHYLRASIARATARNPNPYDGEPLYNLGRTLLYQGRKEEAYQAFYKATWNAAWKAAAYHRLAEIDLSQGDWQRALEHLDCSLSAGADNLIARNLRVIALRELGRALEAESFLQLTHSIDPLDTFSQYLAHGASTTTGQKALDLAFDLQRAGLLPEMAEFLSSIDITPIDGTAPILLYALAHAQRRLHRSDEAAVTNSRATAAAPDYVFPGRLEEMLLLEEAIAANPQDARARYYVGNLLYDRRRHHEAIQLWQQSVALDPTFPTAWRNLGLASFNILHDSTRATHAFEQAIRLAPGDARIFYEYDQLRKRLGHSLPQRLASLQQHPSLTGTRDDLSIEVASLLNSCAQPDRALRLLLSRPFQPWEGGEGLVLAQYVRAHVLLAHKARAASNLDAATHHLEAALSPPPSLSEARHPLMNRSLIDFWLGVTCSQTAYAERALQHLERAARNRTDFHQMQVHPISENTFWSAMALQHLGRKEEARALFQAIRRHAAGLRSQPAKIDYFATSLPAMLLFEEDLAERQQINACYLEAQAALGLAERGREQALHLLEAVLERDPSHTGAMDLLQWFQA